MVVSFFEVLLYFFVTLCVVFCVSLWYSYYTKLAKLTVGSQKNTLKTLSLMIEETENE
jgi:hypothetical protein